MDTADGLAVQNPQRRLQVMANSRRRCVGQWQRSFSLLIKTAALTDLDSYRWLAVMAWVGTLGPTGVAHSNLRPSGKAHFTKPQFVLPRCFAGTAVDAGLGEVTNSAG